MPNTEKTTKVNTDQLFSKSFKDRKLIVSLQENIESLETGPIKIMEVCGGHTMAIHKYGIPSLLPGDIQLLSGPGCPVCVTDLAYIDRAIAISQIPGTIICTYGDLIRVPGSKSSLRTERSRGSDIRIVYSTLDALKIAEDNPGKNIIFLGLGFETTTPASAASVIEAKQKGLKNYFLYSSHKLMQPAMEALAQGEVNLSAYLCPGHVSTVTGTKIYEGIAHDQGLPCVISGFEPLDILQAIFLIGKQIEEQRSEVEIAYKRAVKKEGNQRAWDLIWKVFSPSTAIWRGIGSIENSGLSLVSDYEDFDANLNFPVEIEEPKEQKGCICGTILRGQANPKDCPLFEKVCNPATPVGACMVSSEGSCAAFYKYTLHTTEGEIQPRIGK